MVKIPSGKEFAPGVSIARLKTIGKKARDPKTPLRTRACIRRKKGESTHEIAKALDVRQSVIYDWLRKVHTDGISGLDDKKSPGAKCKLSNRQFKKADKAFSASPRKAGFESDSWNGPMAREYIRREFGIEYSQSAVWYLLERMGFTLQSARPQHPDAASPRQQAAFKRMVRKMIRAMGLLGFKAFFEDEAGVVTGMHTGKGYYKKGSKPTVQIPIAGSRFYMWAAQGIFGTDNVFYDYSTRINGQAFLDFIDGLYKKHGRFVMFLDNASYHKSKLVREVVARYDGDVILVFIPPYTPELNPVEVLWREIKRHIKNSAFSSAHLVQESIDKMLKSGEITIPNIPAHYAVA